MLRLLSASILFCCFQKLHAASQLTVLSNSAKLYHQDTTASKTAWTADMILTSQKQSFGLPSTSTEKQGDVQADVFHKANALVMVTIDGVKDEVAFSSWNRDWIAFESTLDVVDDQKLASVAADAAASLKGKYGDLAAIKCYGKNSCSPNVKLSTEAIEEAKTDLKPNDKLNAKFLEELAQLRAFATYLDNPLQSQDEVPDYYSFSFSSLAQLGDAQAEGATALQTELGNLFESLHKQYDNGLVINVLAVNSQLPVAEQADVRFLQDNNQTTGNATTAENATTTDPNAPKPPTMAEIEAYQIILWTSFSLFVTLLLSVCCMCNMPIKRDSLLYAKFQTEAGQRKVQ